MKKIIFAFALIVGVLAAHSEPIAFRGVVEGYYGRPWGTQGRLNLLEFMGERGMNVFIYGPKDDPYHHSKWREAYPKKELEDFKSLLSVAKKNNINFYWAIHLGSGFRRGNEGDYSDLFKKLGWMYDAGFRSFAVFFDDFGSADAEFHAEVCNRIVNDFLKSRKDCSNLIMCPFVYWGSGHPYQKTLGAKLDKSVHIMWTGDYICSDIRAQDVQKITADFQRPPFIWWNWPVNDYCRSKILLGRTYGLDAISCAGFVSNPMENCEANKIALYSIAEWCKNPNAFDSQKVWEESFAKIYKNPEVAKAMRVFAEHNSDQGPNGHGYRREESVASTALLSKAMEEFKATRKLSPTVEGELSSLFKNLGRASKFLLAELPKGRYDLGWEMEGWLFAQKYQAAEGLLTLKLLKAEGASLAKIAREIADVRRKAEVAAEAHRAKFAEATFANDKGWIKKPEVATRAIKPLIEAMLEGRLAAAYSAKFGRKFDPASGFKGYSTAKNFPQIVVNRDGKFAGFVRIMEFHEIAPGESLVLQVPEKWQTDYFHAKLGSEEPVRAGVIEVSKDGKVWEKLQTHNHGENMERPLDVNAAWRHARYRNVSEKPVSVKINQFKFDVRAVASPIDSLIESIAE